MEFTYILKKNNELTDEEIEGMYQLNVKMYPSFKDQYEKNRYYSYTKPEKVMMVFDGEKLVADVNYSHRTIFLPKQNKFVKLAYWGILVDEDYQRNGIGSTVAKKMQEETKNNGYNVLFATTQGEAERLMLSSGFIKSETKFVWFDDQLNEHQIIRDKNYVPYVWFTGEDVFANEECVFLGTGPI